MSSTPTQAQPPPAHQDMHTAEQRDNTRPYQRVNATIRMNFTLPNEIRLTHALRQVLIDYIASSSLPFHAAGNTTWAEISIITLRSYSSHTLHQLLLSLNGPFSSIDSLLSPLSIGLGGILICPPHASIPPFLASLPHLSLYSLTLSPLPSLIYSLSPCPDSSSSWFNHLLTSFPQLQWMGTYTPSSSSIVNRWGLAGPLPDLSLPTPLDLPSSASRLIVCGQVPRITQSSIRLPGLPPCKASLRRLTFSPPSSTTPSSSPTPPLLPPTPPLPMDPLSPLAPQLAPWPLSQPS